MGDKWYEGREKVLECAKRSQYGANGHVYTGAYLRVEPMKSSIIGATISIYGILYGRLSEVVRSG